MPENSDRPVTEYTCTQNRELSWLRFNRRVLEEATDASVPLLERLRFISIFTSNLDEFFMVRVGSLFDLSLMSPNDVDNKTGMSLKQQLEAVYRVIPELVAMKDETFDSVSRQLEDAGIIELSVQNQSAAERRYINQYYKSRMLPLLSPQIVDSHHPFPRLESKAIYIASRLRGKKDRVSLGLIPVPPSLPPLITMPDSPGRYIRTEEVILQWAPTLFGNYRVDNSCLLCVTRNADISFDEQKFEDDDEDLRTRMTQLLKKRASLSVVRLEIGGEPDGDFMALLKKRTAVEEHQVYRNRAPLNMRYVSSLIRALPNEKKAPLLFTPYSPRWPEDLFQNQSIIEQVRQGDKLLFFPFDRVDPFLRLLSEAADRADVVSIKITIYRMASSSKIAHILCRAAENGKDVTVLMELRARFDEANNISWSRLLEDSGCRVIYGVEDYKCHSKICLITMRDGDKLRYITQIGTGNYNEDTNTMYTDLSLMTADESTGADGAAFFRNLLVGNLNGSYESLIVSPSGMKSRILEFIDREIERGSEGYICVKANAMTERGVIDRLVAASHAGVEVRLILRGICCLRPGISEHTENISVTSIVGRFLEHARVYCFGRGEDAELYISSADLMTRNLNHRVEIACPVRDPLIKEKILFILDTQLSDGLKARAMLPDGAYRRRDCPQAIDSQAYFMEHSLHTPAAPAIPETPPANAFARLIERLRKRTIFQEQSD